MSTASVRQQKGRREFTSFQNSNSSHANRNSKGKWNNNSQHPANLPSRNNQSIPQLQSSITIATNNGTNASSIQSVSNPLKPSESNVFDETAVKHMHDRMLWLLVNLVGLNVQVTVKDGTKYTGLFYKASTEGGDLGVVLRLARKVLKKAEEKTAAVRQINTEFIIMAKDCMEIYANDVDFSLTEKPYTEEKIGFRTDTDISGRTEIRERELHKWTPDGDGEALAGLEDDANQETGNRASWDQFAVNEQLFGLKTDFDEELYTTKLDRSRADYKERERQAIQIANEITKTSTTNVHILEERGIVVEDSQMDEEDRYGAVVRNKYIPPAFRNKPQEQQNTINNKKPEPSKEPAKEVKRKPTPEAKPTPTPTPTPTVSVQPAPTIQKTQPLQQFGSQKPGTDSHGRPIEAELMSTFKQFHSSEKERLQPRKQAIYKKEMDGRVAELAEWGKSFQLKSPLPKDLIPILTKDEVKRRELAAKASTAEKDKAAKALTAEKDKAKEREKQQKESIKEKEKEKENTKEKEKEKERQKDKEKPKEKVSTSLNTDTKPEIKVEEKPKNSQGSINDSKPTDKSISEKPMSHQNDKTVSSFPRPFVATPANSQFKLNAKASEWRPNPNAATFTPTTPTSTAGDKRSPGSSPFFGNRQLKKSPVSLKDSFSPFKKEKGKPMPNPSTIPPTWPFGQRPFRHQFTVTNTFEEDIYAPSAVSQGFGFTYPAPPFRYPAATQYVTVPPITMQQAAPMPYMQPGFVPSIPFTPPIPTTGAPPMYSPQIPIPPQHFGTQGFPSPGRSPMVPNAMHPQMYAYQTAPPQMLRYPHEGMPVHVPPAVMMGQRPVMIEPHYAQPEGAPIEGMSISEPATTQ